MSGAEPPRPLRDEPGEPGRLLGEARELRPWPEAERDSTWQALRTRLATPSSAARPLWAAAALACALGVAGAWLLRPGTLALDGVGHLEFSAGARYRVEAQRAGAAQRILLEQGEVLAQIDHQREGGAVVVTAPRLEVVVVGTRFRVSAGEGQSRVEVYEGRVRAGRPGGASVLLGAGEALASDDPRLEPAPALPARPALATPAPAEVPGCGASRAPEERRTCYRAVASGSGLAAQNALFALAQLERDAPDQGPAALEALREYQRRFPQGAFAPEAALAALDVLLRLGRIPEALNEARAFAQAHADDPRAESVRLIEAELLRAQQREPERALALLQELARSRRRDVQEEALYQRGLCEEALGQRELARASFLSYQQQFPQGVHAGEVAAHLHL